jgi:hypothetical protein
VLSLDLPGLVRDPGQDIRVRFRADREMPTARFRLIEPVCQR